MGAAGTNGEAVNVAEVAEAFKAVRDARKDRGSPELYIADPDLNAAFLKICRDRGIAAGPDAVNKALLHARKSGRLSGLNSTRTSIDYDDFAFACEFAATELRCRTGASVDDILCDPALASEFDSIAARIAPGRKPFEYRWAALSIRKAAGRKGKEPAKFKMPAFTKGFKLLADPIAKVPDQPGVYLLSEQGKALYAQSTGNLRREVEFHRDPKVIAAVTAKLWILRPEHFVVDFAAVKGSPALLQAVERKVLQDRHPAFNVPRSAE
jgi:site-specific DNA-methyltransferase (adenine-specific)